MFLEHGGWNDLMAVMILFHENNFANSENN
jgi:hypothetical protein